MRLAIVEDDPILLKNLELLLNGEPDISVIGTFTSAEETLAEIEKIEPEMILVDLGLPGMSGTTLIKKLKEMMPNVEIMAHTVFDDRDKVFSSLKAGATGYVLKGCTPRELIEYLHILYKGGAPMSPKIARMVINEFNESSRKGQLLLSGREKEVLALVSQGLTYTEVADALNISPHTVHSHIKKIYEKLQAKDRNDAILKARRKGII